MIKARAVVFTAPNTVEYRDGSSHWVKCPDPGPGDVLVRITHSWISNGTEGSFLRGERIKGDTAYRPGDAWPSLAAFITLSKVGAPPLLTR